VATVNEYPARFKIPDVRVTDPVVERAPNNEVTDAVLLWAIVSNDIDLPFVVNVPVLPTKVGCIPVYVPPEASVNEVAIFTAPLGAPALPVKSRILK
jgi:hypothetical protein